MSETNAIEHISDQTEQTTLRNFFSNFTESKLAMFGLFVFVCLVIIAIFAPLIASQNPYNLAQIDILEGKLPPGSKSMNGLTFWLGTDDQGRDMLSAILYGMRISLGVGMMTGIISFALGVIVGLMAAYFGGKVDALIMRIVDLQLSFPEILIAMILLAVIGRGVDKIVIALVSSQWVFYARVVRGTALVELRKDYIQAAECLCLSRARIIFRHLLPNCLPPLIIVATVQVANAIALEANLSFLGVGLPITEPSLGLLISNGYEYMLSGRYWISFFPGIMLLILITSINLVAEQLRAVLNPRWNR